MHQQLSFNSAIESHLITLVTCWKDTYASIKITVKITDVMEIFSYIHAYTKYTLPLNIAATGELGKQRLPEQSERLSSF